MTCPGCNDCEQAQASPRTWGGYRAYCASCQARQFAHSPAAKLALIGQPGALQAAMQQTWPTKEEYRKGRLLVYEWMKKIDEAPLAAPKKLGGKE